MGDVEERAFRQFVTDRTPELFAVAFHLAGRQDAAERLLQVALERLALRWRKVRDPYGWTVAAMSRRRLPWWRRLLPRRGPVEVNERAPAAGRPVDVGDLAWIGARRRRLSRVVLPVAAVVTLGAAAVVVPVVLGPSDRDSPADEVVTLPDRHVVAAYSQQGWHVLNPLTGGYERRTHDPGSISPDLRRAARVSGSTLVVSSTVEDSHREIELPFVTSAQPVWSPDSAMLAAVQVAPGEPVREWFREVALVDVATGDVESVALSFPDGRAGSAALGVFWTGADRLAVATVEVDGRLLPPPDSDERSTAVMVVAVSVFDRAGALVDELPVNIDEIVDSDDPHSGMAWMPTGLVRDDRFLLVRRPDLETMELAVVALADDAGPYQAVTVQLYEFEERPSGSGEFFNTPVVRAWPTAWLADGRIVVPTSLTWLQPYGPALPGGMREALVVDVEAGLIGRCESLCTAAGLAEVLEVDMRVPAGAEEVRLLPATVLSPLAARLAF